MPQRPPFPTFQPSNLPTSQPATRLHPCPTPNPTRPCTPTSHTPPPQAKAKIMVVRDIERDDIEFISKTLVGGRARPQGWGEGRLAAAGQRPRGGRAAGSA